MQLSPRRLALAVTLAVSLTVSAAARSAQAGIDFERAAHAFLDARGASAEVPGGLTIERVLEQHFVRARLGSFEVTFPRNALASSSGELVKASLALIEAQVKWLDWLKPAGRDQKSLREDLATVASWVKSWKPAAMTQAAAGKEHDLAVVLGAAEPLRAAIDRVSLALQRGAALGAPREQPVCVRLHLMPTRRDFLEFLALIGWLQADQRGLYWLDAAADWTQALYGDDQIIALEYSVANRAPGTYDQGTRMVEDAPTVMQQQVVQLALNSLFDTLFEGRIPGAFCQGLSMNLVIDQFHEISTRVDGDLRARVTGKREVFVPGGDKDGGHLTKNSAETRWRAERGKDHWVHLLRQAQKQGEDLERNAKNRVAVLDVQSDDGGKHHAVKAPFLGSAASGTTAPPAEFAGDFLELLRGYKSAFIHWLQTKAAGNEKASREAFARLLAHLGDPNLGGDFEAVFEAQYAGKPLSNAACDKDSLEGQFLLWLQRQK